MEEKAREWVRFWEGRTENSLRLEEGNDGDREQNKALNVFAN